MDDKFAILKVSASKLPTCRSNFALPDYSCFKWQDSDAGRPIRKEGAIAKLFATEAAFEIAHQALQVHGGIGYTNDLPIERYFRDARFMMIGGGTSEIMRFVIRREVFREFGRTGIRNRQIFLKVTRFFSRPQRSSPMRQGSTCLLLKSKIIVGNARTSSKGTAPEKTAIFALK